MFCVKCGSQLPENAGFCPICGNKIKMSTSTGNSSPATNIVNPPSLNLQNIVSKEKNKVNKIKYVVIGIIAAVTTLFALGIISILTSPVYRESVKAIGKRDKIEVAYEQGKTVLDQSGIRIVLNSITISKDFSTFSMDDSVEDFDYRVFLNYEIFNDTGDAIVVYDHFDSVIYAVLGRGTSVEGNDSNSWITSLAHEKEAPTDINQFKIGCLTYRAEDNSILFDAFITVDISDLYNQLDENGEYDDRTGQ